MNLAETSALLTLIRVLDNRRVDDATLTAWQEILADVEFADTRAAVIEHFRTSTAYLLPAHARTGAKARVAERDRIERQTAHINTRRQIEADPHRGGPADRLADLMTRLRATLRPGTPDALRRVEVLAWERNTEHAAWAEREPNPHYEPGALLAETEPRRTA